MSDFDSLAHTENASRNPMLRCVDALSRREGLAWRWQVGVFVLAALAVFSRRPSLFLHAQFYAEDGATWFAQAYNYGWLKSLAIPDGGYLNTLQRLLTGPALLVPFRDAPLLQAVEGLLLQVLPVVVLLSARCRNWGTLPVRCLMAALYVGVPASTEIHVVLTDSQWHFALVEVLLLFGELPRTWVGKLGDGLTFTLAGFCGPFGLMLVPLTLVYWFVRRRDAGQEWTVVLAGLMAIGSGMQIWELAHSVVRQHGALGADPILLVRMLGGEVFGCGLLGEQNFANGLPVALLVVFTVMLLSLYGYIMARGPLPLRMMILFSALIVAGALRAPMIEGGATQWVLMTRATSSRYWAFPILVMVWSIAWCSVQAKASGGRVGARVLLAMLMAGVVHDWSIPAMADAHFAESAARFEAAKPGEPLRLPVYPPGWFMYIASKH